MSFNNTLSLSFSSDPSTMWTAFNKCKLYMEQGQRLEYMSWRRWHQQQRNKASAVHDAHEVSQEECYDHHENKNVSLLSRSSSFCHLESDNNRHSNDHHGNDGDNHSNDDEDDDYYLSDDLYDDEEDMTDFHFVNEFKKTQPRPATPRRSLLSDLLQRVSPPSLLSNSSSSISTHHSSSILTLEDEYNKHSSPPAFHHQLTTSHDNNKLPTNDSSNKWRESFHGW